jgi:hypothetical protein
MDLLDSQRPGLSGSVKAGAKRRRVAVASGEA